MIAIRGAIIPNVGLCTFFAFVKPTVGHFRMSVEVRGRFLPATLKAYFLHIKRECPNRPRAALSELRSAPVLYASGSFQVLASADKVRRRRRVSIL
jgi:hypothetical protein